MRVNIRRITCQRRRIVGAVKPILVLNDTVSLRINDWPPVSVTEVRAKNVAPDVYRFAGLVRPADWRWAAAGNVIAFAAARLIKHHGNFANLKTVAGVKDHGRSLRIAVRFDGVRCVGINRTRRSSGDVTN
jgi:hypothetical protein